MNWYVVQGLTGQEIEIRNRLQKIGMRAYVPQRAIPERKNRKINWVIKTAFPAYVFVCIDYNHDLYYQILKQPGVIRFLGAPEPVPESEMEVVFRLNGEDSIPEISTVRIGDTIQVLDGPLHGMEGQIIAVDKRKRRAKVQLSIMGRVHRIDFGIEILESK
jgi:transcriptional antiterminator NusG